MLADKLKIKFAHNPKPGHRVRLSGPSDGFELIYMETVKSSLQPKLLEYEERIHQLETCYKITSLLNSELNQTNLLDTTTNQFTTHWQMIRSFPPKKVPCLPHL